MTSKMASYLLTGDIGGTNSRMGLYLVGNATPLSVVIYRNADHLTKREPGIFSRKIIYPFLKQCWENHPNMHPIELSEIVACLAIAAHRLNVGARHRVGSVQWTTPGRAGAPGDL